MVGKYVSNCRQGQVDMGDTGIPAMSGVPPAPCGPQMLLSTAWLERGNTSGLWDGAAADNFWTVKTMGLMERAPGESRAVGTRVPFLERGTNSPVPG